MASGKVHARHTASAALVVGAVCVWQGWTLWHAVGVLAGVIITPDLDLIENGGLYALTVIRRVPVLGRPLAFAYRWYWHLYGKLYKHRSKASHLPIVGTAIRLLYAFWWLAILPDSVFYYSFAVGLAIADTLHLVDDLR